MSILLFILFLPFHSVHNSFLLYKGCIWREKLLYLRLIQGFSCWFKHYFLCDIRCRVGGPVDYAYSVIREWMYCAFRGILLFIAILHYLPEMTYNISNRIQCWALKAQSQIQPHMQFSLPLISWLYISCIKNIVLKYYYVFLSNIHIPGKILFCSFHLLTLHQQCINVEL